MRAIAIPRKETLELIESEPQLALAMLRELARRLADAVDGDA
jgi:CRP-like cAMP-binding protein